MSITAALASPRLPAEQRGPSFERALSSLRRKGAGVGSQIGLPSAAAACSLDRAAYTQMQLVKALESPKTNLSHMH